MIKQIIEEIIFDIKDNDNVVKNLILPLLLYFSEITSSVYNKQFNVKSRHNSKTYSDKIIDKCSKLFYIKIFLLFLFHYTSLIKKFEHNFFCQFLKPENMGLYLFL